MSPNLLVLEFDGRVDGDEVAVAVWLHREGHLRQMRSLFPVLFSNKTLHVSPYLAGD